MGKFTYNQDVRVDIDDRLLMHLQVVIGNKLRRGESFYFSWRVDPSLGHGRRSVWIHPYAALTFTFIELRAPQMSRAWIEALATTANSQRGLYAVPEPARDAVGDDETRALVDA